jgi:urease beta subunit
MRDCGARRLNVGIPGVYSGGPGLVTRSGHRPVCVGSHMLFFGVGSYILACYFELGHIVKQ